MTKRPRVLIASNRLPVVFEAQDGACVARPAAGGLATGLRAVHDRGDSLWIGSCDQGERLRGDASWEAELRKHRILPVVLDAEMERRYYDGVCNGVLWPLLHYQTERIPHAGGDWSAYHAVNEQFADAIAGEYRQGDLIWVHDYHLLLLPRMLRRRLPDAPIGFFLHVPFPAADTFRILPWRREVLDGLLGADVLGFHTESYATHFLDAVRTVTRRDERSVAARERGRVHVAVYPMGIDAASFSSLAADPAVDRECDLLRGDRGCRLLLGVDRLDYTKGIPRRLLAYDRLLRDDPSLRGRVRLVQVAVPSRERVPSYQRLKCEIEEIVGRINGEHGTVDWTPIRYVHQSISQNQLVALYRAADVMLVTPLRDGMNLVAKEFVASRIDDDGVLVLSEFAGAADQLTDAVAVNPYSIEEMTDAIRTALAMNAPERRRRMAALRRVVMAEDIHGWAERCLGDLRQHGQRGARISALRGLARVFPSRAAAASL